MKRLLVIICISAIAFASCKKDNYDGPDSGLHGSFFDAATNELIQQDVIRGTNIEIIEHGYDPVSPQYLIVKNDGTYDNQLLFSNTYTVTPVRGNFIAVAPQEVTINGQTKLDFSVTPYIRLKDVNIAKSGTMVTATFKLQQNVTNNVKKIGLYAHSDSRVGEPMRLVAVEQNINAVADPATVYTLQIDLTANSTILKAGNEYYFRVGALIDVGEAKLNYFPVVKIGL